MRFFRAAFTVLVMLAGGAACADPAHDLFTGQDETAADGRIARFACHRCHGRDGRGGVEGDVPDIAGTTLRDPTDLRPAYDPAAFRDALTAGVDASGRPLSRIMPRYDLTDAELSLLWDYLLDLPHRQAGGIAPDSIRFGIVTDRDRPDLGARYLRAFAAEMALHFPAGQVYGRTLAYIALDDPAKQADDVVAALAMPAGHQDLTAQLTATGLPVLFPLTALGGAEDMSIQRGFGPTDRDVDGAIAAHLATTTARFVGISAPAARLENLSYALQLSQQGAVAAPVGTLLADGLTPDAIVDLDGHLPAGLNDPVVYYGLSSQALNAPVKGRRFLVVEAPDLLAMVIDEDLDAVTAHAIRSARIIAKALSQVGREVSRSRLLSVLETTDLSAEHLDYSRVPLNGSDHVAVIEDVRSVTP